MKKIAILIGIILISVVSISVIGCNKSSDSTPTSPSGSTATTYGTLTIGF